VHYKVIYFCLWILTLTACQTEVRTGLNPGDFPPRFKANKVSDNLEFKLAKQKGKVVLLNFWASWCAPCISELPHLQELHNQLAKSGFTVVAVAMDNDLNSVKEIADRFHLTFPVLYNKSTATSSSYKLSGYPESFVLNKSGRLVLINDSINGPVIKIKGDRPWSKRFFVDQFIKLMAKE